MALVRDQICLPRAVAVRGCSYDALLVLAPVVVEPHPLRSAPHDKNWSRMLCIARNMARWRRPVVWVGRAPDGEHPLATVWRVATVTMDMDVGTTNQEEDVTVSSVLLQALVDAKRTRLPAFTDFLPAYQVPGGGGGCQVDQ